MVNLPVVGEISTPWLLGGAAVIGGGYLWYRHNKKNQATTQTPNESPGTTDPNAIDPNTGVPYSQEYGAYTYQPEGTGFGPSGLDQYGSGGGGAFSDLGYYGAGVPYNVQQQATTNAQWAQAAVSALTAQGYDGMAVLAALGLFLTGGHLSADQDQIVRAAIAAEGYPPQGPTTIESGPPGGQRPPIPTPTLGTTIVPNVIGMNMLNATKTISEAHLHPHGPSIPASQRANWIVHGEKPKAGTRVKTGSTVSVTGKLGG